MRDEMGKKKELSKANKQHWDAIKRRRTHVVQCKLDMRKCKEGDEARAKAAAKEEARRRFKEQYGDLP